MAPSRATVTLVGSMALAVGVIFFVHHNQSADRKVRHCTVLILSMYIYTSMCSFSLQRMRQGVERDLERQQKKEENRRLLEEQLELQKRLEQRDKDTQDVNSR